jgi:uncharacterized membrane protein YfcA
MSQLTLARAHAPRGQAWIDTGLRYCLTAVCAGSAGVHAALIQPHFLESGQLGWAFTAAAIALALAALVVRQPRHDSWAIVAASATPWPAATPAVPSSSEPVAAQATSSFLIDSSHWFPPDRQ